MNILNDHQFSKRKFSFPKAIFLHKQKNTLRNDISISFYKIHDRITSIIFKLVFLFYIRMIWYNLFFLLSSSEVDSLISLAINYANNISFSFSFSHSQSKCNWYSFISLILTYDHIILHTVSSINLRKNNRKERTKFWLLISSWLNTDWIPTLCDEVNRISCSDDKLRLSSNIGGLFV